MNALLLTTVLATLTGCPQHRTWHSCCPQPVCAAPTCCQPVAITCCSINCTSIAPAPMAAPSVPAPPMEKAASLYERLGGEAAVKAVVDDFVGRAAGNPKVNFTRKGIKEWEASEANVAKLKTNLVNLIGALTGGPQKYTGKDMKSLHAGMKITTAEFGALAGDLKATLDKFKVPAKEQAELMKIVGSTQGDIVEIK